MIKVTKVGSLLRKEDTVEGGRRAINRKWREWCILLTGSQLLFFRDSTWASNVQAQLAKSNGQVLLQQTSLPQPDEMLSVRDAIAVFDRSYTKVCATHRSYTCASFTAVAIVPQHAASRHARRPAISPPSA